MSAKIRVPKRYYDGLAAILRLDDIQTQVLSTAIEEVSPATTSSDFAAKGNVGTIASTDAVKIYEALQSLYVVKGAENASPEVFVARLLDAMAAADDDRLHVPAEKSEDIRRRLLRLIAAPSLSVAAKSQNLSHDFERTFCAAKVLTDLRPVFTESAADAPVGFMVINTLRLDIHERGDHSSIFVGLSEDDLTALRDAVVRALEKSETLRSRIGASGIGHIDGRKLQ